MTITASRTVGSRSAKAYRGLAIGTGAEIPLSTHFRLDWSASAQNGNCSVTNSFNNEIWTGRTGTREIVPSNFGMPRRDLTFYLKCLNSNNEVGEVTFKFFNQSL